MRIVHITFGFELGGIETMLVNIANEQYIAGHEVHVVVINDLVNDGLASRLDKGVSLHLLGRKIGSKSPYYLLKLNRCLSKLSPDVIHLHYAAISRYILLGSLRRKMCVTLHAMCTPANSSLLSKSGPVFAISDMVREDIKRVTGLDSETVFNGVNLDYIRQREIAGDDSRKSTFNIVQVSRLVVKHKGQDILLKAVALLKRRGIDNIRLTFIGDGESMSMLRQMARDEGVENEVVFLGARSQDYIFSHLKDYDLFVQPSRFEGFGLTVAEAMAAKVPVLVSDNQAPMEVIGYGKYGWSFRGEDTADCADKIEMIMKSGAACSKTQEAWDFVNRTFNIKVTARRYLQLYSEKVIRHND